MGTLWFLRFQKTMERSSILLTNVPSGAAGHFSETGEHMGIIIIHHIWIILINIGFSDDSHVE